MKLLKLLFPKQNYSVLSPNSFTCISVRDLYISRICLPFLLQRNMWSSPGNILIAHRHMKVEIGTEAVQFPEKEYINGILGFSSQCNFLHFHRFLLLCTSNTKRQFLPMSFFRKNILFKILYFPQTDYFTTHNNEF